MLVGKDNMQTLHESHVAVFGVGGVGSFVCESLIRAGVGSLTIVDYDTVDITNVNRQLMALPSRVGEVKVEVLKERLLTINPDATVHAINGMYLEDTKDQIFNPSWDFCVDAIDMVTAKLLLIEQCKEHNVPIICSMGTGNKLDPTKFEIADISKTHTCPLAKVMRKELKQRRIKKVPVVFSTELPRKPLFAPVEGEKIPPASISFVPSVAGLTLASYVVRQLIGE